LRRSSFLAREISSHRVTTGRRIRFVEIVVKRKRRMVQNGVVVVVV
jgi:hypothetical protein